MAMLRRRVKRTTVLIIRRVWRAHVVDTSVAAQLFLAEPFQNEARVLFEAANNKYVELSTPTLILYEMNNALIASHLPGIVRETALFSLRPLREA